MTCACVLALSPFPASVFAQAPLDACALLTPAEVSQALGVTVLPGHHMGSGVINVCTFAPTAKFGPGERQISVTVTTPAMFEAGHVSRNGAASTAATVTGAQAYFFTVGKVTSIRVLKNGKAFEVRMNPGRAGHETTDQIQAIESSLANKAAGRA